MRKALTLLVPGLVFAIASGATAGSQGRINVTISSSEVRYLDGSGLAEASNGPEGQTIERPPDALPVWESLIASESTGMSSAYGFAGMLTSPGGAQVTVNGSISASPSNEFLAFANATAESTAIYSETVRILVSGLPLDTGLVVNASVFTTGTLLAQSSNSTEDSVDWGGVFAPAAIALSDARWVATARVNPGGVGVTETTTQYCVDNTRDEFPICSSSTPGLDLEFFAINGQLVTIELEASARVSLDAKGHGLSTKSVVGNADGVADLGAPASGGTTTGGAVGWGGITAVRTLENPVDLDAVQAVGLESGFDYTEPYEPVPEPGGWLAEAMAACALVVCCRGRFA